MQMNNEYGFKLLGLFLVSALVLSGERAAAFDDYGNLSGQFILKGEIPQQALRIKQGDPNVKDTAICAAADLPANDLVVDEKYKGIANIFVYLRKAKKIYPELEATPDDQKEIVFDQKGCTFKPHALIVRTDQTVLVKSGDNCAHNTHTFPIRNTAQNFILQGNDRTGVPITFNSAEFLPIQVKCDIHPWMLSYWLILDHPYAAKTDKEGRFTINNLPVGDHEFRVWHERVGYIDRKFKVTVEKGGTVLDPVKVPVERFEEK